MTNPDGKLTPTQHEIMELVWDAANAGMTVTEIWEAIAARREVIRSTVLNLVDRLEKRHWLRRRKRKGGYRYFAAVERDRTVRGLAEDFVDDFFGGSASELVMSLMGSKRMKSEDVERLRRLLDERLPE
ncbi:MAG: BlaI/MecI/CopY family transcriptional regulator [Pirellulaceae bacterium]|jgi:predicted transcriptional regulator|nr:BlaI/MecI/CopY family transcriptional regulator [Pirellulaceae bacterium]